MELVNKINEKALYAARSVADKDGNQIDTTYAKTSDIPSIDGLMAEDKLTIEGGKITKYDGTPFAGGSGGQSYTSPNETITVDNTNGTLEATKYAMAVIPGEEVEETMTSAYTPHASQVGTLTTIFADNNNSSIATPITYEFPGTNWSFDPTDFVIKIGDTTIPMENISDNPEYVYSSINLKINERATVKDKDIYFLLFEGFSITLSGDNIGKSIEIEMALKNASPLADVYDVTKKYNESSIEKIELQEKLEPMQLVAGPGVNIDIDEENRQIKVSSNYNETVLWEGSYITNPTNSFILSETLDKFEYVRFEGLGYASTPVTYFTKTSEATDNVSIFFSYLTRNTDNNPIQTRCGRYTTTNGLTFTFAEGRFTYQTLTATAPTIRQEAPSITKVIGINRKGGN